MTKESTEAAFRKAFSNYTLLNLIPEEEASIREDLWHNGKHDPREAKCEAH